MSKEQQLHIRTVSENALAFKALGDETRCKMLGLLSYGELCVCDLMAVLKIPQSTASRHLSYLKNSHWVVGRRKGKWMYYQLHPGIDGSPTHKSIIQYISTLSDLQKEYEQLIIYLEHKDSTKKCS